ncbi:MAG: thioesterase family protein [Candidatus Omnitrophica bacterium]|nr:thioesterase family protein [Candidatus Omnitrophota bacterium]
MEAFYIKRKVYYHHTDAGGVVYYSRYLEFLEEGRSEYLLKQGIDVVKYAEGGVIFPVVRIEVDYKRPARYGDVISIFIRIEKVGNASIQFAQEIKKDDVILVISKATLACIGKDFKVRPIPDEIKLAMGTSPKGTPC